MSLENFRLTAVIMLVAASFACLADAQVVDPLAHQTVDSRRTNGEASLAAFSNEKQVSDTLSDKAGSYANWTADNCPKSQCASCPNWIATADAILLERIRPDAIVLMQDQASPANALNSRDFDFGFQAGWDVSLVRQHESGWGVEGRFFSVDQWDANLTLPINAALLRINTSPPVFVTNVNTINSTFMSELHNFEANVRRDLCGPVTLLGGFRYVELDDQFQASPDGAVLYETATANRLYGFQLGAEAELLCVGNLGLDAVVKAGIYGNASKQHSRIATGAAAITAGEADNSTSFVGEFALTGTYGLSDCWSIRAGYSLIWIESVTLATDQVPVTDFITGTGIDTNAHVVYHGALLGLEFRH